MWLRSLFDLRVKSRRFGRSAKTRSRAAHGKASGLQFEPLEQRTLLSLTAPLEDRVPFDANLLQWVPEVGEPNANGLILAAMGPAPEQFDVRLAHNLNAADTTNADQLWPSGGLGLGLSGAGYTVGVWDGGWIRTTHQEFGGRVAVQDAGAATEDHATHVAGTIGAQGANAAAHGMADQASLWSYDWNDDLVEMDAAASTIVASNHSYGYTRGWTYTLDDGPNGTGYYGVWFGDRALYNQDPGFGKYDANAQALDATLAGNPNLLSVWSAGNDRGENWAGLNTYYIAFLSDQPTPGYYFIPVSNATYPAPGADGSHDGGFDILSQQQTAKNSLVVGAVEDIVADPYSLGDVAMSSFSAWGATDDGRIKPDVVGNGVGVFSSLSSSDTDYGWYDGTSMAAPNVTGTSTLLIEHFQDELGYAPASATTKGVLIHTAFDSGNVGPDYTYGWGVVDAANAAMFVSGAAGASTTDYLAEASYGGSDWTLDVSSDGSGPLKATIVWTDPAGTPQASGLDVSTPVLVHDLDLWVTGPGGTYYPWTLNPASPASSAVRTTANHLDNVEQVLIDTPIAGDYTIHVGRTGSSFSQAFSILLSGASQAPTADLVITANDPNGNGAGNFTPDVFKLVLNGSDLEVWIGNDPANPGNVVLSQSVNFASLGSITVNGSGDDDLLIVDLANGSPIPVGGVSFHGAGQQGLGDELRVVNGSVGTLRGTLANSTDGELELDGATISYTGLEPVLINVGTLDDAIFDLPAGAGDDAILEDDAAFENTAGVSQIRSLGGTFERTSFTNPANSLTVNLVDGDTLRLAQMDAGFAPSAGVSLVGDTASDTFIAVSNGSGGGTVNHITYAVDVQGGGGASNTLLLDDSGDTVDGNAIITQTTVENLGGFPEFFGIGGSVSYSGLSGLTLLMSPQNDSVQVHGTALGTTTRIEGRDGDDLFDVADPASTLDAILGALEIVAGEGSETAGDFVVLFDLDSAAADPNIAIGATTITGAAPAAITYEELEEVTLVTPEGFGTIVDMPASSAAFRLFLGNSGTNILNIGAGDLDLIGGTVNLFFNLAADNIITIDDSADASGDVAVIENIIDPDDGLAKTRIGGLFGGDILYELDTATELTVLAGMGDDTIDVNATSALLSTAVDAGGGNDSNTITIQGDALVGDNLFTGNTGNDRFVLNVGTGLTAASLRIEGNDPSADPANRDVLEIDDTTVAGRDLQFPYTTPMSGDMLITGLEIALDVRTMERISYAGNGAKATVIGTTDVDLFTVTPTGSGGADVIVTDALGGWAGPDLSFTGLDGSTGLLIDGSTPAYYSNPGDELTYDGSGALNITGPGQGYITAPGMLTVNYQEIELISMTGDFDLVIDANDDPTRLPLEDFVNDGQADFFKLVRTGPAGEMLEIYIGGEDPSHLYAVFDYASVNSVAIAGSGDSDTLMVRASGGLVALPGFITFDGEALGVNGPGADTLIFDGDDPAGPVARETYVSGPVLGQGADDGIVIFDPDGLPGADYGNLFAALDGNEQVVVFNSLTPIIDVTPALQLDILATPGADDIQIVDGQPYFSATLFGANPPQGLAHFWNFDEAASGAAAATDLIAAPNNSGLFQGTATRTAGLAGAGAALFNNVNGDAVAVGTTGFSYTTGISIEATILASWNGVGMNYDEIFRKEDGNNRILFGFQNDPNNGVANPPVAPGPVLSFGLNVGGVYRELDMPLDGLAGRPTLAEMTDGTPDHVVAQYDAATGRKSIWVNGTERWFVIEAGNITSGGGAMAYIGNTAGGGEPFTNVIDEVAIYDRALSAAEIEDHSTAVGSGAGYYTAITTRVSAPTFEQHEFANKTTVTVNGLDGGDVFHLDNPNPADGLATLEIYGNELPAIGVNLDDGSADNFDLIAVGAALGNVRLLGEAGDDFFTNASITSTLLLDDLEANLELIGGPGTDTVELRDTNDLTADVATLTDATLTGANSAVITYSEIELFGYEATVADDTIDVLSTALGTAYAVGGDGGSDTFTIGIDAANFGLGLGSLDAILGPIAFFADSTGPLGTDTLNIDDSGDPDADVASIDDVAGGMFLARTTTLTGFAPATIAYEYTPGAEELEVVDLRGSQGGNTIAVNATTASVQTSIDSGIGDDANTITINGDALSAANLFTGNAGNDRFVLNITDDLGSAAVFALTTLWIEGDDHDPVAPFDARDRLEINDLNAASVQRDLTWQYGLLSGDGSQGDGRLSGFAVPVDVLTMETVAYVGDAALNDTLRVETTPTGMDDLAVAPTGANSALVFLNGDPWAGPPADYYTSYPGVAGGGLGPDLRIVGLQNASGLTVAGKLDDRLIVYAPAERNVEDDGNQTDGDGNVVIPGAATLGLAGAYDVINVDTTSVSILNGGLFALLGVNIDGASFRQSTNTTDGLVVNAGFEDLPGAGGMADQIFVASTFDDGSGTAGFPIRVNGGDPLPSFAPQGDYLEISTPGDINVFSDGSNPPVVTITSTDPGTGDVSFPIRFSSIENLLLSPGTGVVNIYGDNNAPGVVQDDYFRIRGVDVDLLAGGDVDGVNEFELEIGTKPAPGASPILSAPIRFRGVIQINAYGGSMGETVDTGVDTLDITAYANNDPLGWGIATYFEEGDPDTDEDMLIVNGLAGVSERFVVQPSASQAGQVTVTNAATNTPIAVINYVSNTGVEIIGNDGSAGDTDSLVLRGTDGVTQSGTSGDETVVADFSATGLAGDPLVRMSDTGGGTLFELFAIHSPFTFDTVTFELDGGDDAMELTNVPGMSVYVDGGAPSASDTLKVFVPGSARITPTAGLIDQAGVGPINFVNVESVDIEAAVAASVLTVRATQDGDTVTALPLTAPEASVVVNAGPVVTFNADSGNFDNLVLDLLGGDDSAAVAPIDGVRIDVVANGNDALTVRTVADGAAESLILTPTAAGAGEIDASAVGLPGQPDVVYSGITELVLVHLFADGDTTQINGTAGDDAFEYSQDATGTATVTGALDQNNATGNGPFLLPTITLLGINAALAGITLDGGAAGGVDAVAIHGTAGNDLFDIAAGLVTNTIGGVVVTNVDIGGASALTVDGADGDDEFNVLPSANHSVAVEGGDPSASDVLNFFGSGALVVIDLDAQEITEGALLPVSFSGVEHVFVDAFGADVAVWGTASDDAIRYAPLSADGGRLSLAGLNSLFELSGVGALSLDGLGGSDLLTVDATQDADTIDINGTSVAVDDGVTARLAITFADVEALVVNGLAGDDLFNVTPAGLPIFVDGGDPIGTTPVVV